MKRQKCNENNILKKHLSNIKSYNCTDFTTAKKRNIDIMLTLIKSYVVKFGIWYFKRNSKKFYRNAHDLAFRSYLLFC